MSSRLELLSSGGLRLDNRRPNELREIKITIEPNPPIGTDSSVSLQHGQTRLISSVSGPKDQYQRTPGTINPSNSSNTSSNNQQIQVYVSSAPFGSIDRRRTTTRRNNDRSLVDLELAIQSTFRPVIMLELYQRSKIEIFIEIVEQDGSLLQASINATTLALISAGVSISDYVLSISVGSLIKNTMSSNDDDDDDGDKDDGLVAMVDLIQEEEKDLNSLTISFLPRSCKTSLIQLDQSRFDLDSFDRLLKVGLSACMVLHARFEEEVKRVWASEVMIDKRRSRMDD
ncbi:ribosomal protein S5 domain 2-type protein [Phakopsora pachyrhizi]|uniref:Ribosomal protein S5 domain 2-type protein n=1 Tax=Phakopsora pachyrhizi TaxID=170000 RepID=A0AAV0APX5_PHAPC|nr:ribosomal protein S5 domain 2-type protein [Phakopsora pachyrhizi]CAH7670227.1 ribosomal protein S5 domain 2-type protein [Phakopsora pachyrhizi]